MRTPLLGLAIVAILLTLPSLAPAQNGVDRHFVMWRPAGLPAPLPYTPTYPALHAIGQVQLAPVAYSTPVVSLPPVPHWPQPAYYAPSPTTYAYPIHTHAYPSYMPAYVPLCQPGACVPSWGR